MEEKKGILQKFHPTTIPFRIFFLIIAILLFYKIILQIGDISMENIKFATILFGAANLISGYIAIRIREFQYAPGMIIKDMPAVAYGWVCTIIGIFAIWMFYYFL